MLSLESIGLLLGFLGAFSQATNYAMVKDCEEKYSLTGVRLLIADHLLLLIFVTPLFLIFKAHLYFNTATFLYVLGIITPYFIAQYLMNLTLKMSDASIVSPLMTIKIPILAVISILFLGQVFSLQQYCSIAVIICLGWYFSSLSGKLGLKPLLLLALTCTMFCLSDIAMTKFTHSLPEELTNLECIAIGIAYEHVATGIITIPAVKRYKVSFKDILNTKWVALTWMGTMIGIVSCFNMCGVVEGNIVQTLRSVIGVIIAYLFYRKYIRDENKFRKKLGIAIGMFCAVVMFYI